MVSVAVTLDIYGGHLEKGCGISTSCLRSMVLLLLMSRLSTVNAIHTHGVQFAMDQRYESVDCSTNGARSIRGS